jgi:FkbM family methyltransferase
MAVRTTSAEGLVRYDTDRGVFWTRPGDFVNKQFEQEGGPQRSDLGMLLHFVREGDVVLDVGGHIGSFAVPLGRAVGTAGRVYSFEPFVESFAILQKNIAENAVGDRVVARNAIVTDADGRYRVAVTSEHTSGAHFSLASPAQSVDGVATVDTPTLRLDDWAGAGGEALTRLDVMKIDTEGMEFRVLRSARGLIERFRPVLMAELSADHLSRQGDCLQQLASFLRGFGYHFFRNLGSRHAHDENFSLARITSPAHVFEMYDLLAIHPSSDRYPKSFVSQWVSFGRYVGQLARVAPSVALRKLRLR